MIAEFRITPKNFQESEAAHTVCNRIDSPAFAERKHR
jgi:hypothetical protein